MKNLAIVLRAAQLTAHALHNLVKGPSFLEDHEYLGELYPAYEAEYDGVIERMIGLGTTVDLASIGVLAANYSSQDLKGVNVAKWADLLLESEKQIRKEVDAALKGVSQGTQNFLQGIADNSEQRTYKLGQRAK